MGKPGPKPISDHCLVEGCDRPYHGRGHCRMHYGRRQRHGDPLVVMMPGPKPRPKRPNEAAIRRQQARLDRWRRVAELRATGLTFAAIGAELGVSRQRAHRILAQCPFPHLPRDTDTSACRATDHPEGR